MPGSKINKRGNPGFTLLELMVALTILSIVLGAIYGSFATTLASKERAEANAEVYRSGRLALNRIAEELQAAYFPVSDNSKAKPLFRGFHFGDEQRPLDSIIFSTLSGRPTGVPTRDADQRVLTYFFPLEASSKWLGEAGMDLLQSRLSMHKALTTRPADSGSSPPEEELPLPLLRRELSPIGKESAIGGAVALFVDNVAWFRLRFHDGEKWITTWDSDDSRVFSPLPAAVEVTLALYDSDHNEHLFSTAVALPMAASLGVKPVREAGSL